VPLDKQNQPCLSDAQLAELAALGRRVEEFYGDARDIEWAWAEGKFWLLQARPITTGGAAEHAQVQQEEIAALKARAKPEGTVWARFNLSEILPEPTPMTWSIVQRFMSGRGGFGLLYQDLGYQPDLSLADDGAYDLICGRTYCNLSREPLFFARGQPLEHDFAALKAEPHKAIAYPQPQVNAAKRPWHSLLLAPFSFLTSLQFEMALQNWSKSFADKFRNEIIPTFNAETDKAWAQDVSGLSPAELLAELERWIQRTLIDFARDSLKPTVLAAVALGKLEWMLTRSLGAERTRAAMGELTLGVRPDAEADLPRAIQELAAGHVPRELFLQRFGHRGNQEMELSQPRWSQDHAALDNLIGKAGTSTAHEPAPWKGTWERIANEAKLQQWQRPPLEAELQSAHTYLGLRETGKHFLMKGYALIRRVLVELDRRHRLNGGIFFLTPAELPRLINGEDLSAVVAQRRRRRAVALSLEVPQVLFSDDLDAIGRPITIAGADVLRGVPLSAGVAEGPALVLDAPGGDVPSEPYVLVCPSTDPAWVPLFVHARGLVMETGGVLSHGAIVAREFGLPAVAGIPDVQRRLRSGQRLRVDGGNGTVSVLPG
jgi:pyruvate,water dikinase